MDDEKASNDEQKNEKKEQKETKKREASVVSLLYTICDIINFFLGKQQVRELHRTLQLMLQVLLPI